MSNGGKRIRTKSILAIVALFLILIALPIVGRFTFYASVVPHLSPVLPKPEGAPADAQAGYNWKGSGLYWHWQRQLSDGCANWSTVADRYIVVYYSPGAESCSGDPNARIEFGFENFIGDEIDFAHSGSSYCSVHTVDFSEGGIGRVRAFLSQSREVATSEAEQRLIDLSERWLDQPKPVSDEHPCGERYMNAPGI